MSAKRIKHRHPPCPYHPNSHVVSVGRTPGGLRRRYRCRQPDGTSHTFSVPVTEDGQTAIVWSAPPACEKHPGSHVTKAGTYGKGPVRRQRYRCTPADGSPPHKFTPTLPRDHVHEGVDTCSVCKTLLTAHQGTPVAARHLEYDADIIAGSLQRLGMGQTYVAVSRWARKQQATRQGLPKPKPTDQSTPALGFIEAFADVIWDPIATSLAEREQEHYKRRLRTGEAFDELPSVAIADSIPFYGKHPTTGAADINFGFHVLAIADITWRVSNTGEPEADVRLRLVRALPTNSTKAWALAFSELGAPPDFIIADGDKAIAKAVGVAFLGAEDEAIQIPCFYHLRKNIEAAYWAATNYGKSPRPPAGAVLPFTLGDHLARLATHTTLATYESFHQWWDDLDGLLHRRGIPADVTDGLRQRHFERASQALDHLIKHPYLPFTSGSVEGFLEHVVKPFFENRYHSFRNIERTNRALNLLVAHHRDELDDIQKIVNLITDSSQRHGGRALAQRTLDDRRYVNVTTGQPYSSLRDNQTINQAAAARGLE